MTKAVTYDQAYEQYYGHLVRYVHQLTYDWSASEDIAQDTMLKAWLHWDKIQPKLVSWLFLVAKREAIDLLRRRKRIAWLPILEIDEQGSGNLEEMQAVGDMIKHLPVKHQEAIVMHIQGYSHKESEDPNKSKYTLANARKKLRTMYQEAC